jgi:hypothetical protein
MAKTRKGMGVKAAAKKAMPALKKVTGATKRQRSAVTSKRQRGRSGY